MSSASSEMFLSEIAGTPVRLHVAGSASPACDRDLLDYAHSVVAEVTHRHGRNGGTFVVGLGSEPVHEGGQLPIVFDWTVLENALELVRHGEAAPLTRGGSLVVAAASQRSRQQVPEHRRPLLDALRDADGLDLRVLPEGWRSGALIRIQQANSGDVLLTLGGGAGVEHLANLYAHAGRGIIPLDFDIGSSRGDDVVGGTGLAARALQNPANFISLRGNLPAAGRLDALSTRFARPPADVLAERITSLINHLARPRCFYVRLLDSSHAAYVDVERFFREVVDPVVASSGLDRFEMGRDVPERAWMNDEIFVGLYFSSLVFVDLTGLRPNCLAELGYALGRDQRVLLTARADTNPPFDLDKIPWFFWSPDAGADELRRGLVEHWQLHSVRPPLVVVPPLI